MFADPPPDYQKKTALDWSLLLIVIQNCDFSSSFELNVKLIFCANLRTQHEPFPSFQIHSAGHSRDPLLRNTLSIWSEIQQKNSLVIRRQVSMKTGYSIPQSQSARNTLSMTILMRNCSTILSLCQKSKT